MSRAVDQKQSQERQQYHDEGIRLADADDWLYLGVRERMFERGNRLGPSQRLFRYPETMFGTFGHFRIAGVTGHFALGVQKEHGGQRYQFISSRKAESLRSN